MIQRIIKRGWVSLNESILNIETEPHDAPTSPKKIRWWQGEHSSLAKHHDNLVYGTPDYWNLRKVVRRLKLAETDVFFDLGCGMGRVLCIVARRRVHKCVGIELFDSLCLVAKRNAKHLRRRKAPIEIICSDAATANLSGGTVYFMFNPFGQDTLTEVLSQIHASLQEEPRTIRIVYYNAQYQTVLASAEWLNCVEEWTTYGGHRVTLWENVPGTVWVSSSIANSSRDRYIRS